MQKFELNDSLKEIIEESIKKFLNIEKINVFYKIDNIPKIKLYIDETKLNNKIKFKCTNNRILNEEELYIENFNSDLVSSFSSFNGKWYLLSKNQFDESIKYNLIKKEITLLNSMSIQHTLEINNIDIVKINKHISENFYRELINAENNEKENKIYFCKYKKIHSISKFIDALLVIIAFITIILGIRRNIHLIMIIAPINLMIIFISYTYNLNSTLDDKHPILKYILWNKL